MPSILVERDRQSILSRLDKLRPDMQPKWGRMNASQMLAHLADGVRMALGDLPVQRLNIGLPLRYPPLKQLIVYVIPFPKGAPAAPEIMTRTAEDWDKERAVLQELMRRFLATTDEYPWGEHFLFGKLSRNAWAWLGYKHFDHHFRQFGI